MKRLEHKHPLAIRWFHWINFPVLTIMVWSGLLVYWANDVYRVGIGNFTLFHFFPTWFYHPGYNEATGKGRALYDLDQRLAEGMGWHFLFMWFFIINGLLYVLYTALSGEWRYLLPNRDSLREAIQVMLYDLHLSKVHPPRRKFNGAQQIAYTGIILMGASSLITGLAIYKPVQFAWLTTLVGGYTAARFIHFWLTMGYIAFFLVHVIQVIRAGWNNFRAMITGYEIVPSEELDTSVVAQTRG
jgi:thiosulfate reductase cytochrome b subunit